MKQLTRWSLLAAVGIGIFLARGIDAVPAGDKKGPDGAALDRTREQVKMLDDLYKTAVVSITNSYVEGQSSVPAAMVAKDVFEAMKKKGYHRSEEHTSELQS